jgi:hypothetical protein
MIVARRIGLLAVALLLGTACANAPATDVGPRASSEATETIAPDLPTINWKNPLGKIEKSLDEARSQVAFDPQPPNLGTPEAISVDDPEGFGTIAFVYADPEIGEYCVHELLPTMTQDQLEQLATCQPAETNCSTEGWSLEPIRKGVTALVIYGPETRGVATSVTWLEGGLQYTLMGPRSTMTQERAIEIANQV